MNAFTIESKVAVILVGILVVILFLGTALCVLAAVTEDKGKRVGPIFAAIGAGFLTAVAVFGLWWGMYPWKAEYHQYRPVAGTVERIDSRIAAGANDRGVQQKYVVTFTGNPQPYGVLDTRAAGVRPGDRLEIACVRRWQQAGTDGYDCMFGTSTPGVSA